MCLADLRAWKWVCALVCLNSAPSVPRANCFPLTGFPREWPLTWIGEDTLQKAWAIVAFRGQVPFRELEAAKYFLDELAPIIILVPLKVCEEVLALDRLGVKVAQGWQYGRKVLLKQGVQEVAIVVAKDEGEATLEELCAAYNVLPGKDTPVILVTSKSHVPDYLVLLTTMRDSRVGGGQ